MDYSIGLPNWTIPMYYSKALLGYSIIQLNHSIGLLTTEHIRTDGEESDQLFVVLCVASRVLQRIVDVRVVKE